MGHLGSRFKLVSFAEPAHPLACKRVCGSVALRSVDSHSYLGVEVLLVSFLCAIVVQEECGKVKF